MNIVFLTTVIILAMNTPIIFSPNQSTHNIIRIQPNRQAQNESLQNSGLQSPKYLSQTSGLSSVFSQSRTLRSPKSRGPMLSSMRIPSPLQQLSRSMRRSNITLEIQQTPISPCTFRCKNELLRQQLRIYIEMKVHELSAEIRRHQRNIEHLNPYIFNLLTPLKSIQLHIQTQQERLRNGKVYTNDLKVSMQRVIVVVSNIIDQTLTSNIYSQRYFEILMQVPMPPDIIEQIIFTDSKFLDVDCLSSQQQKLLHLCYQINGNTFSTFADFSMSGLRALNYSLVFIQNFNQILVQKQKYSVRNTVMWFSSFGASRLMIQLSYDFHQCQQLLRFEQHNQQLVQQFPIVNYVRDYESYYQNIVTYLFEEQSIEQLLELFQIKPSSFLIQNIQNIIFKVYKLSYDKWQLQILFDIVATIEYSYSQTNHNMWQGITDLSSIDSLLCNYYPVTYNSVLVNDYEIMQQKLKLLNEEIIETEATITRSENQVPKQQQILDQLIELQKQENSLGMQKNQLANQLILYKNSMYKQLIENKLNYPEIQNLTDIDAELFNITMYDNLPTITFANQDQITILECSNDSILCGQLIQVQQLYCGNLNYCEQLLLQFYQFDCYTKISFNFERISKYCSKLFILFLDFCYTTEKLQNEDFELSQLFTINDFALLNLQDNVQKLLEYQYIIQFLQQQQKFDMTQVIYWFADKIARFTYLSNVVRNVKLFKDFNSSHQSRLKQYNIIITNYVQIFSEWNYRMQRQLINQWQQNTLPKNVCEQVVFKLKNVGDILNGDLPYFNKFSDDVVLQQLNTFQNALDDSKQLDLLVRQLFV